MAGKTTKYDESGRWRGLDHKQSTGLFVLPRCCMAGKTMKCEMVVAAGAARASSEFAEVSDE